MTEKDQESTNHKDVITEIEIFLKGKWEIQQLVDIGKGVSDSLRAFMFALYVLQKSDDEKLKESAKKVVGMIEKGEIGLVNQNHLLSNEEEIPIIEHSFAFFGDEKRPVFIISPYPQPEESETLNFAEKIIKQTIDAVDGILTVIEIFESEVDLSEKFGDRKQEDQ